MTHENVRRSSNSTRSNSSISEIALAARISGRSGRPALIAPRSESAAVTSGPTSSGCCSIRSRLLSQASAKKIAVKHCMARSKPAQSTGITSNSAARSASSTAARSADRQQYAIARSLVRQSDRDESQVPAKPYPRRRPPPMTPWVPRCPATGQRPHALHAHPAVCRLHPDGSATRRGHSDWPAGVGAQRDIGLQGLRPRPLTRSRIHRRSRTGPAGSPGCRTTGLSPTATSPARAGSSFRRSPHPRRGRRPGGAASATAGVAVLATARHPAVDGTPATSMRSLTASRGPVPVACRVVMNVVMLVSGGVVVVLDNWMALR